MNFLSDLKKSILNIPGWHTKRKIVVIESDDWGSIRMPSRKAFEKLTKSGLDLTSGDSLRYNTNDTLAGIDDLSALFDILRRYKDQHGNHPVFTALSLVANPDFEKIRKYDFQQYFYEPITATLQRYYPTENVFQYWQQGIKERLFIPQFHGREHLNVNIWMNGLRDGDQQANAAFNEGMWGYNNKHPSHISLQAAFDPETEGDIKIHGQILVDGIKLFQELFGYKPTFFVPPNGILHESLYEVVKLVGINYVFSSRLHRVPIGNGKFKTRFNYLGKRNNASQLFIIRKIGRAHV